MVGALGSEAGATASVNLLPPPAQKRSPPNLSLQTTRSCLARSWSKRVQRMRSARDRYARKLPFLLVLLSVSHHIASARCNNIALAELLRGRHAQAA
jgi:hypothetical protein